MGEATVMNERTLRTIAVALVAVTVVVLLVGGLVVAGAVAKRATDSQATSAQNASTASSATAEAPAQPTPSPYSVGEIFDTTADFSIGVAGGKLIHHDGTTYLALKIYLKNSGTDFSMFEDALRVDDGSEELVTASDDPDASKFKLQALDTVWDETPEGSSSAGWLLFEVQEPLTAPKLYVGDTSFEEDAEFRDNGLAISLVGYDSVNVHSEVVAAFNKALRESARRIDAADLTMSEYKAVKTGMTLQKVNSIVGFKGEQLSSYGSYKSYSWQNDFDGSNMLVSFHGNRVYSKAQSGL